MLDNQGRNIDYIRISVTDRCNLRCRYCMPEEGVQQVAHDEILTFDEILHLARIFAMAGISHIKITGGEPLVRKNVTALIKDLKKIPGIETVTMTTNGLLLEENLPALADAGVDGINISLDTLKQERYKELTGTDGLGQVLSAIDACGDFPQIKIKINAVTLADFNRDEILALASVAAMKEIDVRFIEMMPVGLGRYMKGYSQDEIFARLTDALGTPEPLPKGTGPAEYFRFPGFRGRIGFISAVTHKFCGSCNRVRLSSQGFLKTCLHYEDGTDLRSLIRSSMPDEEILSIIEATIKNKPAGHNFGAAETAGYEKKIMAQIGG